MCDALRELFAEDFEKSEQHGIELGREQGEKLGIQLAKDVFRLAGQGLPMNEIASQCNISIEKVQEILQ